MLRNTTMTLLRIDLPFLENLSVSKSLESYNIRKIKPYTGPAIPVRARVVHQAEGQAHYFFVEEANRMEAYIFERSIAGGRECSKLEGLHHWPPIHN